MGGEWVSVFISPRGFTRDEELALFWGAPKGGSMVAATVCSNMTHDKSI